MMCSTRVLEAEALTAKVLKRYMKRYDVDKDHETASDKAFIAPDDVDKDHETASDKAFIAPPKKKKNLNPKEKKQMNMTKKIMRFENDDNDDDDDDDHHHQHNEKKIKQVNALAEKLALSKEQLDALKSSSTSVDDSEIIEAEQRYASR